MILQDMIRRVQRLFGDSAEAQVYVTDIIDWINDGQFILNRDLELLLNSVTYTVDSNTAVTGWVLPNDYVKSVAVLFELIPMTYRPYIEIKDYVSQPPSDPGFYYIWSSKIRLHPVPVTYGANIVTHEYVRVPSTLKSSGDTPDLPVPYHLDLVRYCLMRSKELNEDEQAVSRINQEFVTMVAESKFNLNPSETSYPVIRDYAGDHW